MPLSLSLHMKKHEICGFLENDRDYSFSVLQRRVSLKDIKKTSTIFPFPILTPSLLSLATFFGTSKRLS